MKILLTLLLAMSAAGTLPFLVYLIVSAAAPRHMSAAFRYACMKFFLVLYLVPVPMIRYFIMRNFFSPASLPASADKDTLVTLQDCIVQFQGGFVISGTAPVYRVLTGIWLSVLCFVLVYNIVGFLRFKRQTAPYTEPDTAHQQLFENLKKKYHIGKHTRLYQYHSFVSPFTMGMFRPAVFLTDAVKEEDTELILRHELCHVKSHDFTWRTFAITGILIHWFNPFIYVYFNELKEVQELACDERLLAAFSTDQMKQYGYLLINTTVTDPSAPACTLHFSRDNRIFLKKRISRIGQNTCCHPFLASVFAAVLCVLSAVPVYFYSPKTVDFRKDPTITASELQKSSWVLYTSDDSSQSPEEALFKYTDLFFVSDDGTVTADLSTPVHPQNETDDMTPDYINQQLENASRGIVKPAPRD